MVTMWWLYGSYKLVSYAFFPLQSELEGSLSWWASLTVNNGG